MSSIALIASVIAVWTLLSLIGGDRVERQQAVDAAAKVADAAAAKRRAAEADAQAVAP